MHGRTERQRKRVTPRQAQRMSLCGKPVPSVPGTRALTVGTTSLNPTPCERKTRTPSTRGHWLRKVRYLPRGRCSVTGALRSDATAPPPHTAIPPQPRTKTPTHTTDPPTLGRGTHDSVAGMRTAEWGRARNRGESGTPLGSEPGVLEAFSKTMKRRTAKASETEQETKLP